jgi:integrase
LAEAGKSASTIRQHHAILSGALGQAVKWGWCPVNVVTMATSFASRGDVSARTLAVRLGHADASVSLKVYRAFFPPADAEAAEHVGRLLNSA